MTRFDRYMLAKLLLIFGFFSLILVSVFWINRAVSLFDRLIGDGQSALIFAEFTALSLPRLIATIVPIAAFSTSVFVTNRLISDNEMTVVLAAGRGPGRLVRPVLVFALIVWAVMSLLVHVLVPMSNAQLSVREAQISRNITARLLSEGTFLTPAPGVTFFTREIGTDGVLYDVFLSDRRNPQRRVTYTAAQAYLVRPDAPADSSIPASSTTLIMVNGLAQRLDTQTRRLSTANFTDFSFDISALISRDRSTAPSVRQITTLDLVNNWRTPEARNTVDHGRMREQLHARIAQSLFAAVSAVIGFCALMIGGFSRFGLWRESILAFVLLIALDGMRGSLSKAVINAPELWPIMYFPGFIGLILCLSMLAYACNPYVNIRKRTS